MAIAAPSVRARWTRPICRVLPIAPSTCYDHLAKRADPARLSDRTRRDAALRPEIERIFEENWRVYGVCKVWRQLDREGFDVARCTVARLMKDMGIQGIIRGKPHKTTFSDKKASCPLDKVNRQFRVPAPKMLWGRPLWRHWYQAQWMTTSLASPPGRGLCMSPFVGKTVRWTVF